MVGSLTELLRTYPENDVVIDNWVEGIFPLILDVEQKAAEKVQEVNWEDIICKIQDYLHPKKPNSAIKTVDIHFSFLEHLAMSYWKSRIT